MNDQAISLAGVKTMTSGYSDSEDRVWLSFSAEAGAVQMWLTRRQLEAIVSRTWKFLGNGLQPDPACLEPAVQAAPALLAERLAALAPSTKSQSLGASPEQDVAVAPRPVQAGMLTTVRLEAVGHRIQIRYQAMGGAAEMLCTRPEVHRILDLLARRTVACRWSVALPWQAV
jgi:hypothetical protein